MPSRNRAALNLCRGCKRPFKPAIKLPGTSGQSNVYCPTCAAARMEPVELICVRCDERFTTQRRSVAEEPGFTCPSCLVGRPKVTRCPTCRGSGRIRA